ncbi:PREDICTED: uncharacterized protein LOC107332151 [Acropora digitifera]|uniref:uncharacterized protein LOC107332151 n=1 Tax=Acropora digitifera TaxID=70779 RepID=UPI00077A789E|nr:PREDICTED: uncharacterized protein LOC107332151 [Acropora digitifera]
MAFVKVEMIAGKAQRKEHESGGDKTESRRREECASNDKIQLQHEGNEKRIEWKENAASVGTAVEPKSDMQNLRSAYLYDRDPLRDPRFTRLVDQLVPLRTSLSVDRAKMVDVKRKADERLDVICFKDICLNETCRLVYKVMNKGKENS